MAPETGAIIAVHKQQRKNNSHVFDIFTVAHVCRRGNLNYQYSK
jgi:hypothetical protein